MIKFVTGDIFYRQQCVGLAHGCNVRSAMGAGIALEFKKRWPDMYLCYREYCKEFGEKLAGTGYYYDDREQSGHFICNLFTQIDLGACAKYEFVEKALIDCRQTLDYYNVESLALPLIGGGIGGLKAERIKDILRLTFGNWCGKVVFYEKYVPNQ